jgi:hypothetical protein
MSQYARYLAVVLVGVLGGLCHAQGVPAVGAGQGGMRQGGQGLSGIDPVSLQQRVVDQQMEQIHQRLAVTDDEWTVLQPKLEALIRARTEAEGGGLTGTVNMFVGRSNPTISSAIGEIIGRLNANAGIRETNPISLAQSDLNAALADPESPASLVTRKVRDVRDARQAAQKKLDTAQEALRDLLSLRQEAELVMMGYLR